VINVTKAKQLTICVHLVLTRQQKCPTGKVFAGRGAGIHTGDEYVEVTPKSIRMRKILLDRNDRERKQKASVA